MNQKDKFTFLRGNPVFLIIDIFLTFLKNCSDGTIVLLQKWLRALADVLPLLQQRLKEEDKGITPKPFTGRDRNIYQNWLNIQQEISFDVTDVYFNVSSEISVSTREEEVIVTPQPEKDKKFRFISWITKKSFFEIRP